MDDTLHKRLKLLNLQFKSSLLLCCCFAYFIVNNKPGGRENVTQRRTKTLQQETVPP